MSAERLEPRRFAGGMVALTPDELLVGGGAPAEDGLDASLFGDEEEKDFAGSDLWADPPPPLWLGAAEPELAPEADPLSPAGDPEAGTLAGDGMTSFSGCGGCCGGSGGCTGGTGGGTVTVTVAGMGSASEDNGGTTNYFRFTANGGGCGTSPTRATATFTLGGTATKDVDYTGPLTAGTVDIPMTGGFGEKLVAFTAVDDLLAEDTETVIVQPAGATADNGFSATFASSPQQTIIFDNERRPTLGVTATAAGSEDPAPGQSGPKPVEFTVSRAAADGTNGAVTARYQVGRTGDGAVAADYVAPPGTVTIPDGQPSAVVRVVPTDDQVVEPTETLSLTLVSDPSYDGGGTYATGNIVDNDVNLRVSEQRVAAGSTQDVIVTAVDYDGGGKAGVALAIQSFSSSIISAAWGSGGSTTDASGIAKVAISGVANGVTELVVGALLGAARGRGNQQVFTKWDENPTTEPDARPFIADGVSTPIGVSPDETVTVHLTTQDRDSHVDPLTQQAFKEVWGVGPYDLEMEIQGDATFENGQKTVSKRDLTNGQRIDSGNVKVKIGAMGAGAQVRVRITVIDNGTTPEGDEGTVADEIIHRTWVFTRRAAAPTGMAEVSRSSNDQWVADSLTVRYKMLEDLGADGRPDYVGQSVQENFADPGPIGWTLESLKAEWLEANGNPATPEAAAKILFGESANASFVVFGNDWIDDEHSAVFTDAQLGAFKQEVRDNAGIAYSVRQTYSVAPIDGHGGFSKTYTILRKYKTADGARVSKA